jgi:crossover junction endodeoxyribonuclease RusA
MISDDVFRMAIDKALKRQNLSKKTRDSIICLELMGNPDLRDAVIDEYEAAALKYEQGKKAANNVTIEKTEQIQLTLPFPPSINHYWKHRNIGSSVYISAEGVKYRQIVANEARKHENLGTARVSVQMVLNAPNKRKYDIDNRVKALLDALTHAELWNDDEQVDELIIRRGDIQKNNGEVKIIIKKISNE